MKDFYFNNNRQLFEIKNLLNNAKDPLKAVHALQEENNQLRKQVEQLLKEKARGLKSELMNGLSEVNGVKFLAKKVDLDAGGMKDLLFEMGNNRTNLFALLLLKKKERHCWLAIFQRIWHLKRD